MAIARFLDHMCLALRASGLWLHYTALQNLIPSFPWIAPGWRVRGRKEGITFVIWQPCLVGVGHEVMEVGRQLQSVDGLVVVRLEHEGDFGAVLGNPPESLFS